MLIMVVCAEVTEEQVVQTIHYEILGQVDENEIEYWSCHGFRVTNSQHQESCSQSENEKS
jgi:hypothetical protein